MIFYPGFEPVAYVPHSQLFHTDTNIGDELPEVSTSPGIVSARTVLSLGYSLPSLRVLRPFLPTLFAIIAFKGR